MTRFLYKHVPYRCEHCGRFVTPKDAHVVEDGYAGGFDAAPVCPPGKGCAAPTQGGE